VHRFTRHLRGLLVALATLALSAGVVLAARPASVEAPAAQAADGLKIATEASGQTVPVRVDAASATNVDEDQDEDSEAPKVEAGAESDTAANAADRPQNHGWFVSEAAHAATAAAAAATTATPGSIGLAVSTVARSDVGKPDAATAAAAAKAAKPAKSTKPTSN
jgi:hypothetical protein